MHHIPHIHELEELYRLLYSYSLLFSVHVAKHSLSMGKKGSGSSWLTAVKRAFRSPSKDSEKKSCRRKVDHQQEDEEEKVIYILFFSFLSSNFFYSNAFSVDKIFIYRFNGLLSWLCAEDY